MKISVKLILATLVAFLAVGCGGSNGGDEPGPDPIDPNGPWQGEWVLKTWNGATDMAGKVYILFTANGQFTIYQNIDKYGFQLFSGTYSVAEKDGKNVLSGSYTGGAVLGDKYVVTLSSNNKELTLTATSGEKVVTVYTRTEIPAYVKDGVVASDTRAAGQGFL